MGFFEKVTELFGGTGTNIIKQVTDTVDRFVATPEEKSKIKMELQQLDEQCKENERKFQLELQKLIKEEETMIEDSMRMELNAQKEILLAELNQSDNFTKRARPTVVYAGLVVIFLEIFGLRPLVLHWIGASKDIVDQSGEFLKTFLVTWGSVVGVYSVGRSFEKRGSNNNLVKVITGNSTPTQPPADTSTIRPVVKL